VTDVVDSDTRSRMMSGIKGKNTKPELLIRKALFSRGFRYRLHDKKLAGKPDLVFPRYKAAVFIHGCFWHGHDCHLFKWPSTRPEFWQDKITGNRERDAEVYGILSGKGWRILTIWECALKGRTRIDFNQMVADIECWIKGKGKVGEIRGGAV
jgi:DNA mismatch endonuclease (patch repair protein)